MVSRINGQVVEMAINKGHRFILMNSAITGNIVVPGVNEMAGKDGEVA